MSNRRAGFTLVELLVTVAIIGLLISSASLPYSAWIRSNRLRQGTELLVGSLREAQVRAFRDGRPWRLSIGVDGRSVYLEPASDSFLPDPSCTGSGWSGQLELHATLPDGMSVGKRSDNCVVYGSSGRVISRSPGVLDPAITPVSGQSSVSRLTDGHLIHPLDVETLKSNTIGLASWRTNNIPSIEVDLRELRHFESIRIDLLARPNQNFYFPERIVVQGTIKDPPVQESDWTINLLDVAGPPSPGNGPGARHLVTVPVNQQLRLIRIKLTGPAFNNRYFALDEIDFGPRFFQLKLGQDEAFVEVNPTTGRVTVRGVK